MENLNKEFRNTLKPPKKFFEWCYSHIPNYKWKNKQKTIIASNRKNCPLIEKRLTVNSRLDFYDKNYFFTIILVTTKRIEIQTYDFLVEIKKGKQTITWRLKNIEKYINGKRIKAHQQWCGGWYEGFADNYGFMSGAYSNTIFFPNNWKEKVQKLDRLKYLDLTELDRYTLPNYYKYYKEIEYCQKINAIVLANEIIYKNYTFYHSAWLGNLDMRICTFKWLKKNKAIIKNSSKPFSQIYLELFFKRRKGVLVEEIGRYMTYRDFNRVPKGVSITKFQKWIIKNKIPFRTYLDYLSMVEELEIRLDNELVVMPRDFQKKHDDLAKTIAEIKLAEKEAYLTTPLNSCRNYEMEIGNVAFVAPKNLKDIVQEGSSLGHCVGSNRYLESHKEGKTTIMFVRDACDKETPLYTLEYRSGKIIQVQGKGNRSKPTSEYNEAIDQWVKKAQRRKRA